LLVNPRSTLMVGSSPPSPQFRKKIPGPRQHSRVTGHEVMALFSCRRQEDKCHSVDYNINTYSRSRVRFSVVLSYISNGAKSRASMANSSLLAILGGFQVYSRPPHLDRRSHCFFFFFFLFFFFFCFLVIVSFLLCASSGGRES